MKLWSENIPGNLHQAVEVINGDRFWVSYEDVIAMSFTGGNNTQVVFKVTDNEFQRLKEKYRDNTKEA